MERYVEETKKLDIKLPKKKLIINENYDQLQKSVSFNVIPTEDNFVKKNELKEKEIFIKNETISNLQNKINEMRVILLKEQNINMEKQIIINNLKEENTKFHKKVQNMRNKYKDLKTNEEKIEKENLNFKKLLQEIGINYEKEINLIEKICDLEKETENFKNIISLKNEENDILTKRLSELNEIIKNFDLEISNKKNEIIDKTKSNEDLKNQIQIIESHNNDIFKENKIKIDLLQQKIDEGKIIIEKKDSKIQELSDNLRQNSIVLTDLNDRIGITKIQDLEIQNLKKIITNIKEETELKSKQITYQLQDIEKKQKEINELTIEIQNIKKNKTEQIHDEKTKESIEQIKNRRIDLLKIQGSIYKSLLCSYCSSIIKNPITCIPCGHSYCAGCINGYKDFCCKCGNKSKVEALYRNDLMSEMQILIKDYYLKKEPLGIKS